jgi:hypothetical protein
MKKVNNWLLCQFIYEKEMYKLCSIKLKWCNDFPMVIDERTKRLGYG